MKNIERRKIENKIIEKNARFHILNTNVTHVNWDVVLVRKSVGDTLEMLVSRENLLRHLVQCGLIMRDKSISTPFNCENCFVPERLRSHRRRILPW